eukprot:GEMP01030930.1.p1 GENE.GEMP01030930.1~~GEMP01030930.1.p1  ORF type:complete len:272 (-),score=43.29 GEMP01030930.1:1135-1950(-)
MAILELPADAIHVSLGSLESEVDEVTAAEIGRSDHFSSNLRSSREAQFCFRCIDEYSFENTFIHDFTSLMHESRADDVKDFFAQPSGKKYLEFGSIFRSGPCTEDSAEKYDVRLDFLFCLFQSDEAYTDKINAFWREETRMFKYSGHPEETERNVNGLLDLLKLSSRQRYLNRKKSWLMSLKRKVPMDKARRSLASRRLFSPMLLVDVVGLIRAIVALNDDSGPTSTTESTASSAEGLGETQEDRDRAGIHLSDDEKKRLLAADILRLSWF